MTDSVSRFARKFAGLLIALIVAPAWICAQTSDVAAKPLTLNAALTYALEHYPAVRAALEQVAAARAGVGLAHTQYLPQLNGVYQVSRATQNQVNGIWLPTSITPAVIGPVPNSSDQSYWGSQALALLSWEPIDFGLRPSVVGLARSSQDKAASSLAVTKLQVATAVGNLYLTIVATQQIVAAAQADVDRWQVFARSVHALVDNELRPGVDASRADAQLAIARSRLFQAQQSERASLATLAALIGSAAKSLELDPHELLNLSRPQSLPITAPADNPFARDQMATIRQTQAQEKVLSKTDYPRILVQAEAFARGSEVPVNGSIIGNWNGLAPARGNWIAGVTVIFPNVFDFKALSAQKQMAKATENSQRALYDKTVQDLTGQVQAALAQLKGAQLVAQQTPVELTAARAAETQSRARYDASLAPIVEVADAEALLAQAEMDDALARLNVWRSLFTLAFAQGDLQPFLDLLQSPAPPSTASFELKLRGN